MITRLRSRFPATCSRAPVKSKVNIYYRERVCAGGGKQDRQSASTTWSFSREPRQGTGEVGSRTKENRGAGGGAPRVRKGCVGGRYAHSYTRASARSRTHTHTPRCDRAMSGRCMERFRVGIIRIRNLFLPRGSTTTSSYILCRSPRARPFSIRSLRGPPRQMHGSLLHIHESLAYKTPGVKRSNGGYVIFQGFMALSRGTGGCAKVVPRT